ncbi:hypothetical protein BZZ01_17280 [Nostocales cyanobacterium HT-58-2]|nr:hypothetical protein BZZ01_17280 [Nostocales cyanobacterium HT-58-2]
MKLKSQFIVILAGTISLVVSLHLAKTFAQIPVDNGPIKVVPAGRVPPGPLFPELAGINLTEEQQKQIWQIQQEIMPQIAQIIPHPELTEEQKNQLRSGQSVQITIQPPTAEQKAKLRELFQTYQQRVETILTPEQQQKFRENLKNLPPLS